MKFPHFHFHLPHIFHPHQAKAMPETTMFHHKPEPLPPWKGGFAESNDAFLYPHPDLSSLRILDNMANVRRITRQQQIFWPEFSWETEPNNPDSRCFQRFAHDISSIGYDDTGRIWSIICPQQGACLHDLACFNVEVTVTGQRGWVNEEDPKKNNLAADMSVEGKVWFSPSSLEKSWVRPILHLFNRHGLPFPFNKENAIQIRTHKVCEPNQPIFPVLHGLSPRFEAPDFARHPQAWANAHIDVEIGHIISMNNHAVDEFNSKIIDLFNRSTGNMLLAGNVLSWNLWFLKPEGVNTQRWKDHAQEWRESIDAEHGPQSTKPFYANHEPLNIKHTWTDTWHEIIDIGTSIEALLLN
ncbi:hypothetical protein IQ260_12175 [Leptolyngbya cf. ectocarpi LEGE 11479]|uniref:Uncharacterized protein n=1 Tax=Leptolyngbya cf. ectocarpi LEGE 11479 TaxID=1828722 RepID=A0A928ZTZ3_LEPEC|nr:hypothetical protein [Leptolyngbya ectocarpi]MBE9067413.1 hypothetical protein [Leptolyngbya cf. ectocarpi LEGE 11479]